VTKCQQKRKMKEAKIDVVFDQVQEEVEVLLQR
jgi:hypothetical protein